MKLVSLRNTYGESKTAVLLIPSALAKRLCGLGRLQVGLVYTRVRLVDLPPPCFRCLAFGHTVKDCCGVDRNKCCWRCGELSHLRRDCTASEELAKNFAVTLRSRPQGSVVPTKRKTSDAAIILQELNTVGVLDDMDQ